MENQKDSSNVDNPPSVENLSITEEDGLNNIKDVTLTESTRPPEEKIVIFFKCTQTTINNSKLLH